MSEQKDWGSILNETSANEVPPSASKPETKTEDHPGLEHPSYEVLETKLTEMETKANDYWNEVLRLKAEIANIQRRADKDVANAHRYALEKFVDDLLPVVDNLERSLLIKIEDNGALKDMYVGIELTLKIFLDVLQKFGVTQINPQGEVFNPAFHTAISTEPGATPNVVLKVIQKGYLLKDRLLRPALVIVSQ